MAVVTEVYEGQFNISEEGVEQLAAGLEKLNEIAKRVGKNLASVTFKAPKAQTSPVVKSIKKVEEAANSAAKATTESFEEITESVDPLAEKQREITQRFDNLREAGASAGTSLQERFQGLSLAISQPGARLQGLREAFFGTTQSSNLLARSFDRLISRGSDISRIQGKLQEQIVQLSSAITQSTRALKNQDRAFRDLAQTEGVSRAATEELSKQLTRVRTAFEQVEVTAKQGGNVTKALQRANTAAEGLRTEYQQLISEGVIPAGSQTREFFNKTIQDIGTTESRLQGINVRYKAIQKDIKKTEQAQEEQTDATKRQVSAFSLLGPVVSRIRGLFQRNSQAAEETNQKLKETEQQIGRVSKAANSLKSVFIAAFGGAAVGGAIGGFAGSIAGVISSVGSLGGQIQETSQLVTARLGEIPEQAGVIGGVIRQVFRDNFGQSAQDVGDAVSLIATQMRRFGDVTDDELTGVTENIFRISDAFGSDYRETVDAATSLVRNFGISWDESFDFITGGFQRGLNSSGDFLDSIREYSVQFANANAGVEGFFNILDTGLEGGVLGTDKAADAFKEFQVRILDGSDTTATALAQIGINADEFTSSISSGETTITEAFDTIIGRLRQTEDQATLMQAGVGLIGTQFEDLGAKAALSLSATGVTLDDLSGKTQGLDLQYQTFSSVLRGLGRNIAAAFAPAGTGLLQLANQIVPAVNFALQTITPLISAVSSAVSGFTSRIVEAATNVLGGTEAIKAAISGVVQFVIALIEGDWNTAWDIFAIVIANAAEQGVVILQNMAAGGFQYGFNLIAEVANGIIEAANTVLVSAINAAMSLVASFLPSSPAEQGPLSNLDQMGKSAIETFSQGMGAADLNFVIDALDPIAERFEKFADEEEGLVPFQGIRENLTSLVGDLNKTGQINEQIFGQIAQTIQAAGDDEASGTKAEELVGTLRKQLELRRDLTAANKDIASVSEEIAEAEAAGFVPQDLKDRLAAAQARKEEAEGEIKAEKDLQRAREQLLGLDKKVFQQEKKAAKAGGVGAIAGTGARLGKSLAKSLEDSLSDALPDSISSIADKISANEARLSSALVKPFEAPERLFGTIKETATQAATGFTSTLITGARERLRNAVGDLGQALVDAFKRGFQVLRNYFLSLAPDQLFPISVLIGAFASPVVFGFFSLIDSIVPAVLALVSSLGGLGVILRTLLGVTLRWSVAGLVVFGIITRWDEVVETATAIIGSLRREIGGLVRNFLGFFARLQETGQLQRIISNFASAFSLLGLAASNAFGLILLVTKKVVKIAFVGIIGGAIKTVNRFIEAFGGIERFADSFGTALEELSLVFKIFAGDLALALDALFVGDFIGFFNRLQGTFGRLQGTLAGGGIANFISDIGQAIRSMLPPAFVTALDQLAVNFQGFFDQGRLGGEIIDLLVEIFNTLRFAILENKEGFIILATAIAAIAAIALNTLISALQALAAALPFVEGALTGFVIALQGAFQVINGLVLILRGLAGAIIAALTGGDIEAARQLFFQGFEQLGIGLTNLVSGLVQTLQQAFAGLLVFVSSFFANFVNNIGIFTGGVVEEWGQWLLSLTEQLQTTIDQLLTIWGSGLDVFVEFVKQFVPAVIQAFKDLYMELVGGSIVPQLVADIISVVASLPLEFVKIGTQIINSLVDTIKGGASRVLGAIGGLFRGGGGEQDASGEQSQQAIQQATASFGQFSTLVQQQLTALQQFIQLTFTNIQTGWTTMLTAMLTVFQTTLQTKRVRYTQFDTFLQTRFTQLQTRWQALLTFMVQIWQNAILQMTVIFQEFINTVLSLMDELIAKIVEVGEAFEAMAEAAQSAFEAISDGLSDLIDDSEEAIEVIEDLDQAFQKLEASADRAAEAARGVTAAAKGAGITGSAQHGALDTGARAGLWLLHPREMVLPAKIADPMREVLRNLASVGIGGDLYRNNLAVGGASLNTDGVGAGATKQYIFGPGSVVFPNVTNGRDASGIERQLDRLTRQGELRGRVVG